MTFDNRIIDLAAGWLAAAEVAVLIPRRRRFSFKAFRARDSKNRRNSDAEIAVKRIRSFLPSATKGSVELNQGEEFVASGLSEIEFGPEEVTVGIQSIQKRVDSTPIPHIRQA
jgi:hypothetical protein